jgi:hypothetical protein
MFCDEVCGIDKAQSISTCGRHRTNEGNKHTFTRKVLV